MSIVTSQAIEIAVYLVREAAKARKAGREADAQRIDRALAAFLTVDTGEAEDKTDKTILGLGKVA